MQAQLSALTTNKDTKTLANPRIQVLDNDSAKYFHAGDVDVVNPALQLSHSPGLTGNTVQVQEFPVGIILLVRPRVNADGKITLRVHPVISTVTGIVNSLPQTSQREAETTVMIQDGETMVIGGLISEPDDQRDRCGAFPIKALPLVGELFKNRTKDHTHSEIMVFITPHILK